MTAGAVVDAHVYAGLVYDDYYGASDAAAWTTTICRFGVSSTVNRETSPVSRARSAALLHQCSTKATA